jgi:hypothetical protein
VLYELVVGRVPFSADTPFSIIHDHIYKPLPRPRTINPTVPESVERVLFKALAKNREDRYAKVEDLVSAFRAAVGPAPSASMPDLAVAGAATRAAGQPSAPPAVEPVATPAPSAELLPTLAEPGGPEPRRVRPRPRPWAWVVAGLAMTCICLSSFVLLARPGRQARLDALSAGIAPGAEIANPIRGAPSVADAYAMVGDRPDDPQAHVQLGNALLADHQAGSASTEFLKAAELARDRGDIPLVADASMWALDAIGGPFQSAPAAREPIESFLFLGADSPRMQAVTERAREAYPDWTLAQAATARTFLFGVVPRQGLVRANDILGEHPGDPFARAVSAEYELMMGDKNLGKTEATNIIDQGGIPGWLIDHLNAIIKRAGNP